MKDETTGPNLPEPLREGPGRASGRRHNSVRQRRPKKREFVAVWLMTAVLLLLLLYVFVVRPLVPPDARMPPIVYAGMIVILGLGTWYGFKASRDNGRKRPKK